MALVSLFFQTRAQLGQLDLDVSINETHEASATLTQSEVEDGSNITDNVVLSSVKLTIEGGVSQSPLGSSALAGSIATAIGGIAAKTGGYQTIAGGVANVAVGSIGGLVSSAVGLDGNGVKSRSASDVFEYLLELRNKRQPFTVLTALRKYENMVLTSLSVPRNSQTVGMLRFTATLEQITYVSSETVDIGSLTSIGSEAAKKTNLGKQAPGAASTKAAGSMPSVLSSITGVGA